MSKPISSRHDIPEEVQNIIKVAIEKDILDPIELYVLATNYGKHWPGLIERLLEYAYADRHVDGGKKQESITSLADEYFAKIKW